MYQITVIKKRMETEEETENRIKTSFHSRMMDDVRGPHLVEEKHLEVTITNAEFAAVKKAVIETL